MTNKILKTLFEDFNFNYNDYATITLINNACKTAKHQFKDNECIQMSISHNEKKYDIIFDRSEIDKEISNSLHTNYDRLGLKNIININKSDQLIDLVDED